MYGCYIPTAYSTRNAPRIGPDFADPASQVTALRYSAPYPRSAPGRTQGRAHCGRTESRSGPAKSSSSEPAPERPPRPRSCGAHPQRAGVPEHVQASPPPPGNKFALRLSPQTALPSGLYWDPRPGQEVAKTRAGGWRSPLLTLT